MSLPTFKKPQRPSTRRHVIAVVSGALLILGAIAFITWESTAMLYRNAKLVLESRTTIEYGEEMMRRFMEMESEHRSYLLTGDKATLNKYEKIQRELFEAIERIEGIVAERPEQRVRIERAGQLIRERIELERKEIETRKSRGLGEAAGQFSTSRRNVAFDELAAVFRQFKEAETVVFIDRSDWAESIGFAARVIIIVGTTVTFVALTGAGFLIQRDVGRRQRAELALKEQADLLEKIMDAMPELVFVKDLRGHYIMQNLAHRVYLGLRRAESIEEKTVFDIFPRDLAELYHADDQYVLQTGAPIRNREEPARPASPNIAWLSTTKMPLRDAAGHITGVLGVSTDITARKEIDEKLKRFAAQLERSNAELQSFASVASHDLQEPLRKIQAFGDRLRAKCSEQLGEQGRDYLARMQNAAERMQVLIQDLLKLSRIASRAQPFEPCNLGTIVADVLGDLEIAIEDRQARVEVGELPVIDADPLQMRQLFQNLIINALKFQKPGEPPVVAISGEVAVATGSEIAGAPRGSELCRLTVRDNGIGFEQKFADQIFVVFQRLHTRQEYEGTGIGLAVCRKITDRHGGTIVADSEEGQGATFIVTLPVKHPKQPDHD